jgi:hypothetical protein
LDGLLNANDKLFHGDIMFIYVKRVRQKWYELSSASCVHGVIQGYGGINPTMIGFGFGFGFRTQQPTKEILKQLNDITQKVSLA